LQQTSRLLPGGFEFLRLAFAHQSMALRHQRQSAGQLHALLGGVVPVRFSFNSFSRLRVHALGELAAALSCSKASLLGFSGGSGEEVVRSRDVGSRRVAMVQLCVPLQRVLQLSNGVAEVIFSQKEVKYSLVWADFVRKTMWARTARRPRPEAPAELAGAWLHLANPLCTCEKNQRGLCTRIPGDGAVGWVGRGVCKMRT
jgi:hypothetical protein